MAAHRRKGLAETVDCS